ncbi:hypothetical protein EV646_1051, partial [Kribbella antiqua]
TTTSHPDGSITLTTPTGHRHTTVPPARGPITNPNHNTHTHTHTDSGTGAGTDIRTGIRDAYVAPDGSGDVLNRPTPGPRRLPADDPPPF